MAITGTRHRVIIEGAAAVVRLGYQKAATLGAWRVEGDYFSARIEDLDAFRITQSPLTLEIQNPDGIPTRRPLADVKIYQGQLSARLLPKQEIK